MLEHRYQTRGAVVPIPGGKSGSLEENDSASSDGLGDSTTSEEEEVDDFRPGHVTESTVIRQRWVGGSRRKPSADVQIKEKLGMYIELSAS
jgi:hypothetical protein